jgi:hypothetical protein
MNLCGTVAGTDSAPPGTTHTVSQGLPLEKVGKPRAQPELDWVAQYPKTHVKPQSPVGLSLDVGLLEGY